MESKLKEIVTSLQEKFPLSDEEILDCVEHTFSEVLSQRYKKEVVVFFNESNFTLEILLYVNNAGVCEEHRIPIEKVRGFNTISKHIERNLTRLIVLKDFEAAKRFEGDLIWGQIMRFDEEDNLHVKFESRQGFEFIGVCELRYQPMHEREHYILGETKAFRVRKISINATNSLPKVVVELDRTSKTLVEQLIKEKLANDPMHAETKVKCAKRISGAISDVAVSELIPRDIIKEVSDELKERIRVKKREGHEMPDFDDDAPKKRVSAPAAQSSTTFDEMFDDSDSDYNPLA